MKWPTTTIQTPDGARQAIAPSVISASRATDIPAFHSRWFMERLQAGHCVWRNPFTRNTKQYVSFSQCKMIVFWSKNPAPLMPYLAQISDRGMEYYFQFTLNDYVAEGLEPKLPSLESRMETFMRLSEMIGRERVIWRFDPVVLGESLTVEGILEKIAAIGQNLSQYTEKFVFSFADIAAYKKVRSALRNKHVSLREPSQTEMIAFAEGIAKLRATCFRPLATASCAEKIDLSAYGIEHNKCIDDRLINTPATGACPKDPGQRRECGCIAAKDIGAYGCCPHMCVYCYANPTEAAVASNMARCTVGSEALLP